MSCRLLLCIFFPYTTLFRSLFLQERMMADTGTENVYWSEQQVLDLFKKGLLELLWQAQQIHRQNHSPDQVELATLLSRSEEHTSELQSRGHLVCRLLLQKKK